MPLYEFRCANCDYLFEQLLPASGDNPVCPVCKCPTVRIFNPAPLRFKGSGFHCTDYTRHHAKR